MSFTTQDPFTGKALATYEYAPKRQVLEVGGSDPYIVCADAALKLAAAKKLAARIAAGQVAVNEIVSTDISRPFGGVKNSGIGRELGTESYFEFTQTKVITTA